MSLWWIHKGLLVRAAGPYGTHSNAIPNTLDRLQDGTVCICLYCSLVIDHYRSMKDMRMNTHGYLILNTWICLVAGLVVAFSGKYTGLGNRWSANPSGLKPSNVVINHMIHGGWSVISWTVAAVYGETFYGMMGQSFVHSDLTVSISPAE